MTPELLTKRCRCGRWLLYRDAAEQADGEAFLYEGVSPESVAIFTNHRAADRAAEAAGWQVYSESIGGDLCPTCKEEA